ncbi:hypothetical protein [Novosphingobium rosa]|uniref:hypothetical protein n=1 Tax=Novosphingobium rosa TaxID=76978 RepID=UPI000833C06F|nr:hypothetical protein [Novosphingobium rosa]
MNRPFQRRAQGPTLSREAADRQGRILSVAIQALGAGGAMTFLNAHDTKLGARPLDLAIATSEGFRKVEAAILARKAN